METLIIIVLFWVGIYFVYAILSGIFGKIGEWNDERKRKVRDRITVELISQTDITPKLIESYREKLQTLGFKKNFNPWIFKVINSDRQQRYQRLVETCPSCKHGYLKVLKGKYGRFLGCDAYPNCRFTKNVDVAMDEYKEKVNKDIMEFMNLAYQT